MADKTNTSTQIRNFYSDKSYMNIKFYNTNLSFQFYPSAGNNSNGRNSYAKEGQMTTVNFENAYALYGACNKILNTGNIKQMTIHCAGNAILTLMRQLNQNNQMETVFSINKNGITIPFVFKQTQYQTEENGQTVTKTIESGLGAFVKTIEGYLIGINSERHLNKLTDDYIKTQESNPNNKFQTGANNGGYNKQYNKPYNNYRKPYQNNNQQPQSWESNAPQSQNMSEYKIQE